MGQKIARAPVVILQRERRRWRPLFRRQCRAQPWQGREDRRRGGHGHGEHDDAGSAALRRRRFGRGRRAHANCLRQRRGQLAGAGEALPRVRVNGLLDHLRERQRQVGARVEQRPAGAPGVRRAQAIEIRAVDGVLRREQIEEQHADRVDVARDRRRLSRQELRRHVGGGAARPGQGTAGVREPEVHQQDPAALLAHHVAGLDVAVDESRGMDCARCPADVEPDQRGFAWAKGALQGQKVRQRRALHEVAPEADPPVVLVHTEDRDDVRVSDPGHRPRLGQQRARLGLAVLAARQEQLQRDVALERRVEGAVDLSEPAASHALHALERPPAFPCLGRGNL